MLEIDKGEDALPAGCFSLDIPWMRQGIIVFPAALNSGNR